MQHNALTMNNKLLLLCLITLFLAHISSAQQNIDYSGILAESTVNIQTAGSTGNSSINGNIDYYTGRVNINIPLYTLPGRGISVPISLSYNTGGIKVEEIASWVGLGWNLNAAGSITREIKGTSADEDPTYGFYAWSWFAPTAQVVHDFCLPPHSAQPAMDNMDNLPDSEPDVFNFTLPGGPSGKFVLDRNGKPRIIPHQDIVIVPGIGPLKGTGTQWIFTTNDGTQYIFDNNSTYTETTQINGVSNISKWHISRIRSANLNDEITYTYTPLGTQLDQSRTIRTKLDLLYTPDTYVTGVDLTEKTETISILVTDPKRLSQIQSSQGRVTFNATTDRLDLPGDKVLNSIVIEGLDGTVIKKFTFNNAYFCNAACIGGPSACFRLNLSSFVEENNGIQMPPCWFMYNLTENLPNRNSIQQDYWGYYNNNTSSLFVPPDDITFQGSSISLTGADRSPNEVRMQANILTRITLPTGGTIDYQYLANRYNAGGVETTAGGLRLLKTITTDNKTGTQIIKDYIYNLENTTTSSGSLYPYKKFSSIAFYNRAEWNGNTDQYGNRIYNSKTYKYVKRSSSPVIALPDRPVGYACVTEKTTGNGKTVYKFDSYAEKPDDNATSFIYNSWTLPTTFTAYTDGIPFVEPTSNEYKRGLLKESIVYGEDGLVKKRITNSYFTSPGSGNSDAFYGNQCVIGMKKNLNTFQMGGCSPASPFVCVRPASFLINYYMHLDIQSVLTQSKEENGYSNGILTNTTDYIYDGCMYTRPSRIVTTKSDGKTLVTNFTYPGDYDNTSNPVFTEMLNKNMVYVPVETVIHEVSGGIVKILSGKVNIFNMQDAYDANNVVVGKQIILSETKILETATPAPLQSTGLFPNIIPGFKFSHLPTGVLPPGGLYTMYCGQGPKSPFSMDTRYKSSMFYEAYDKHGSLTQYKKADDVSTCIIYENLNNTVGSRPGSFYRTAENNPIAQVTNAKLNQVAHTSFESDDAWPTSSAQEVCTTDAHSGKVCRKVLAGNPVWGPTINLSLNSGQATKYVLSCWINTNATSVVTTNTGYTPGKIILVLDTPDLPAGTRIYVWNGVGDNTPGWKYVQAEIDLSNITTFPLRLAAYVYNQDATHGFLIDDFRVQPKEAFMNTATYTPLVGKTSESDVSNTTTFYEYDELGRLKLIKDDSKNIMKRFTYNYKP